MIRPFYFETQKTVKPFSIDPKMIDEKSDCHCHTCITSDCSEIPMKVPFYFLREDVGEIAENLCLPLQSNSENKVELIRHVGIALQNYIDDGNQIPCVLPAICQNKHRVNLNFRITLRKKIISILDTENGEVQKISYRVSIELYLSSGQVKNFESDVESDKIKSFAWITRTTESLAKIPREKEDKIAFDEMVQACIETQDVPVELIYPNAGWRHFPNSGWRYVYGDGAVGVDGSNIHTRKCNEKFHFPTYKIDQSEIFREAMEMRKICKSCSASTMLLLFTHASTMQTFFAEVNFPINFVLAVVGITNSRKTSLALEMGRFLNKSKKNADAEFTATSAGIEKTLSLYKDAVILIDDFRPAETRADQQKLHERLEALVRFYGNRVPKKRMDDYSSNTNKFFPIQGLCVLTMEILVGVQSSLSRMMTVEIDKNEVQNDVLLHYQQKPWILSSHIFDFIRWETVCQDFIMKTISNHMPCLRTQYVFEYQRFGEMFAVFHIVAFLIGCYAQSRGFWNCEESDLFVHECDSLTLSLLRNMETKLKKNDKGLILVQALFEAIENRKLSATKLNTETSPLKYILYEDDFRIFVQTKALKKIAEEYCLHYKIDVIFTNEDEIITALERLEILDIYKNGTKRERARKLPIQHGNHLRYLYIIKELAQKRLEEI